MWLLRLACRWIPTWAPSGPPRLSLWLSPLPLPPTVQHERCQADGAGFLLTHLVCCATLGSGHGSPNTPSRVHTKWGKAMLQPQRRRGQWQRTREKGLCVASWCIWGCYSCSWAEGAFPGAGCPRSVLITWDVGDSSGCFWARLFSLERSGSDGLPCPWTRFEGQETMA